MADNGSPSLASGVIDLAVEVEEGAVMVGEVEDSGAEVPRQRRRRSDAGVKRGPRKAASEPVLSAAETAIINAAAAKEQA